MEWEGVGIPSNHQNRYSTQGTKGKGILTLLFDEWIPCRYANHSRKLAETIGSQEDKDGNEP